MLASQFCKSLGRQMQSLVTLAKTESHLLLAALRDTVKARPGHTRDADFTYQGAGKLDIMGKPKSRNVGHDVVSPMRDKSLESCFCEHRQKEIPPRAIFRLQLIVVLRRQRQSIRSGRLQRGRGTHGQKVVNL